MSEPTPHDVGAAMMAWYNQSLKDHPDGLVTQAQASIMLNISRMAVSRLVSRGYLRAVYFPKPPDIEGLIVTEEYPAYVRLLERLGMKMGDRPTYDFPKACYVSFGDVCRLWRSGEVQNKCKVNWAGSFGPLFNSPAQTQAMNAERAKKRKAESEQWHKDQDQKERSKP